MPTGVKDWLQHNHISYRNLADEMNQSVSGICKKINGQTPWSIDDLLWLKTHHGLSYDFVIDNTPRMK